MPHSVSDIQTRFHNLVDTTEKQRQDPKSIQSSISELAKIESILQDMLKCKNIFLSGIIFFSTPEIPQRRKPTAASPKVHRFVSNSNC